MKLFNFSLLIFCISIFYFSCNNKSDSHQGKNEESIIIDTISTTMLDIEYEESVVKNLVGSVRDIVNSRLSDKKKFELIFSELENSKFIDNSEFALITDPITKTTAKSLYDNSKKTYWVTRTPPVYFDLKPLYDSIVANGVAMDKAGMMIYSGKYLADGKRTVVLELTRNNGTIDISSSNLPEAIDEYFNYGEVCPLVCPTNGIY